MLIRKENHLVTLINVFATRPEQQQALIEHWIRFVDSVKGGEPGLIGTALHRSTDGTHVVNYAQWRPEQDLDRFRKKYRKHVEALSPRALRIDLHVYEVIYLSEQAGR
jgi:Antibiotic biosynthesis monooxygenase